jgi:SAM-dependent methyltransferase
VSEHNAYFDEAYFERGWERGTAYVNYRKGAENSKTFAEIAEAIAFVFQPQRVLEIGCATGATVRHLNDRGIETYGVDVSVWAVENRLHENVVLAGVEKLPFSSGEFDLVFSSHSLEHIPETLADAAFAEMDRVSKPGGYQFHMLPIVGIYPYDFNHDAARQMLREDPTHNLLEPLDWWHGKWRSYGWEALGMDVHFINDAGLAELSSGQFSLSKSRNRGVTDRAGEWNRRVHRKMFLDRAAQVSRSVQPIAVSSSIRNLGMTIAQTERRWRDIECKFDPPISFAGAVIHIIAEVQADSPTPVRVALVDETDPHQPGVIEMYIQAIPGVWSVQVDTGNFVVLSGKPDISNINQFLIGGELENTELTVAAAASFPDGRTVQITKPAPQPSGLWNQLTRAVAAFNS